MKLCFVASKAPLMNLSTNDYDFISPLLIIAGRPYLRLLPWQQRAQRPAKVKLLKLHTIYFPSACLLFCLPQESRRASSSSSCTTSSLRIYFFKN